jgi:hypothetical protein
MSMSIYEIDGAILSLVDMETGEIEDEKRFDELQMERTKKIENIGLLLKNTVAEAKAIKEEEQALAARRKTAENKVERLKNLLAYALRGEKFSTPKLKVSYRKSRVVNIDPQFIEWAESNAGDLLTYSEPKVNKTAVRDAIDSGRDIKFAAIEERQNMQVK